MPCHLLTLKTGYPQQLAGRKIKRDHSIKRRAAQFRDFGLHLRLALLPGAYFSGGGAAWSSLLIILLLLVIHTDFVLLPLEFLLLNLRWCELCPSQARTAQ
ncbi:hypothetical protein A7P94_06590 [Eikenella sp. NML01-A-086]|nr:hypothetical protein A7P94_06590 [Eikenella sp. NML01-A-086]